MEERFIITEIVRVTMVGKDEYREKTTSFTGRLYANEIIFHFSGQATVYFGDTVLETKENTIRFLPEGDFKKYMVDRKTQGECIFASFRTDRPISPAAWVMDVAHNDEIGPLFKKMFAAWCGKEKGYYFKCLSLLYRIFAEIQGIKRAPKQHSLRLRPAEKAIADCFLQESLSVSSLAALCGMGESYFQRLFKEKHGVSPKKYIIRLKINYACDLLRLEEYTVSQVAEMCGFSDVYFFSRQFKEYMGITPRDFIKKYKSSK